MLMGLGVGVFVAAIALAPPVDQPAAGRVEGRDIRVPAGFLGTIYAEPPEVRYPTCLASAPRWDALRRDRRERIARPRPGPGPGRPLPRPRRRRPGRRVRRLRRRRRQPARPRLGRPGIVRPPPAPPRCLARRRRRRPRRSASPPDRRDRLRPRLPGRGSHHQRDPPGDRRLDLHRGGRLRLPAGPGGRRDDADPPGRRRSPRPPRRLRLGGRHPGPAEHLRRGRQPAARPVHPRQHQRRRRLGRPAQSRGRPRPLRLSVPLSELLRGGDAPARRPGRRLAHRLALGPGAYAPPSPSTTRS